MGKVRVIIGMMGMDQHEVGAIAVSRILMEAGIPLAEALEGEDVIMATMSPGGKVVKATHWGDYSAVGPVHDAINQYIKVMKLEFAGAPWEVYVTDPTEEP